MGIIITVYCNKCKKEIAKENFKIDPQNEKAINFIKGYPKIYGLTLCKKCENLWNEKRAELDRETKDKLKSFLDD